LLLHFSKCSGSALLQESYVDDVIRYVLAPHEKSEFRFGAVMTVAREWWSGRRG
jgi:hypothetical protein